MRECQLFACVLLALISQSYVISVSGGPTGKGYCPENEYWNNKGFCCDKCHAGFKLKEECPKNNTRSLCVKCENGTFLETANHYDKCFSCRKCSKANSIELSPCTFKRNRECGCKPTYYFNNLSPSDWECSRCRKCGPGQLTVAECGEKQNTKCQCKENHYAVPGKNLCLPCAECQDDCPDVCKSTTPPNILGSSKPTSPPGLIHHILVPVCACITVLAVGVFLLYEGIRLWKKKSRALSSQQSTPVSDDQTLIITVAPDKELDESVPFTNQPCEPELNGKLPDCVPREIKIHEFFYFVLDEVPIGRFKELVRRLGVSEQNIDRAEQDHRNSKDAHYQMLKVWSDSGSGGGNNVLPWHRIQMFVDTLKDMYLVNCADNIESRFLSKDPSTSN
ncbi:tumor necrosis factor receptor superfamily member 1A [Carassius gibelio]|uniref:tumor necrosis factor receptor superfamily member 1A n=1 Tax=Carassius gibelio TaxID=101364 RepID=UPI0022779C63|nr:tumor necrosis factor receptor superfamily member 1A [Carassius gibelio]XP_052434086.1 tumor necrosis factor receptor superfamily member 1A [Carassius gibelio]XP_052434087.1 tumor necrosis factor receptor superfamily member 1A [Carassius gibelio]